MEVIAMVQQGLSVVGRSVQLAIRIDVTLIDVNLVP